MTHIENIPHILKYGVTHKNSAYANPYYVTIGDISLINTRSLKRVNVDNGKDDCPIATRILLGDYIPFYFGVRMPMLYVMQNGGNFVAKATNRQDIVYVVCTVENVIESGNEFYFSDGHATDSYTTFYDSSMVVDLIKIINWNAVKSKYWSGVENLELKREKQAEFLVLGDIPPKYLFGFGCYDDTAKKRLMEMGIENEKIKVIPNAYY